MPIFDSTEWSFPPVESWPDDDVIAVGADLAPDTLLYAYAHGFFPMYLDHESRLLGWWSPQQRGVLPLHGLIVSRSLRQSARKYTTTFNVAFRDVMLGCASQRDDGNWITDDFLDAYCELHSLGWAHSVETWDNEGQLVGGLYGVRINGFFAGESMFHQKTDASKVALVALVGAMQAAGMILLDTQWKTEHLGSLGVIEVPRLQYLSLLAEAVNMSPRRQ
jgi:leucyl/phenylalanyl-tRNA---protein transferase